jgi:hypothetical protein
VFKQIQKVMLAGFILCIFLPAHAYPDNKSEKTPPGRAAMKRATIIHTVRYERTDDAVRVIVETDGAAQFTTFALPFPYRIVVDFPEVRNLTDNKTLAINTLSIEKVRIGQPGANTVRLVIDTKAPMMYGVKREGTAIVITIDDLETQAKTASQTNSPTAGGQVGSKKRAEEATIKGAGQPLATQMEGAAKPAEQSTASPTTNNSAKSTNASNAQISPGKTAVTQNGASPNLYQSNQDTSVVSSPPRQLVPRIKLTVKGTAETTVDLPVREITVLSPEIVSAQLVGERLVKFTGIAKGESIVIVSVDGKRLTFVAQVDAVIEKNNRQNFIDSKSEADNSFGSLMVMVAPGFANTPAILRNRFDYNQRLDKDRTLYLGSDLFKFFGKQEAGFSTLQETNFGFDRIYFGLSTKDSRLDLLDSELRLSPLSFNGYTMRGFHLLSAPDSRLRGAEVFAGIARPSSALLDVNEGLIAGGIVPIFSEQNWRVRAGSIVVLPQTTRQGEQGGAAFTIDGQYEPNNHTHVEGESALANGGLSWRGRLNLDFDKFDFQGEITNLNQSSPLVSIGAQSAGYKKALASIQYRPFSRLIVTARYFHTEATPIPGRQRATLGTDSMILSTAYRISRGSRVALKFTEQRIKTFALSDTQFELLMRNTTLQHSASLGRFLNHSFEGRITSNRETSTQTDMEYGISLREELRLMFGRRWSATAYTAYTSNTPSLASLIIRTPSLLPPLLRSAFEADPAGFFLFYRNELASILPNVDLPETRSLDIGMRLQGGTSRFMLASEVRLSRGEILSELHRDMLITSSLDILLDTSNSLQLVASRFFTMRQGITSRLAISYTHRFGGSAEGFQFTRLLGLDRSHIEGQVFSDSNGNGNQDIGERGVPGIKVNLDDVRTAMTDAEGYFHFTLNGPGTHKVALLPGEIGVRLRVSTETEQRVTLGARQTANVNFGILTYGFAAGRIFNDLFLQGKNQAESFPGIGGVRLRLRATQADTANEVWETRADATGKYEFRNLPTGSYLLELDAETLPANFRLPQQTSWPTTIQPLQGFYFDIPIAAQRAVSGFVFIDNDGDRKFDASVDTALQNSIVRCGQSTVSTDSKGAYLLKNLPAGKLEIIAQTSDGRKSGSMIIEMAESPGIQRAINIPIAKQ